MAGLKVEVVCAERRCQQVVALVVDEGTTVGDAVLASGLIPIETAVGGDPLRLGIYGKSVAADAVLHDGDRVEIYRPLKLDPKAARRAVAARNPQRIR